jgi:site-specific DNA recombinase
MRRRNTPKENRLTIGYVRVSTQEQADRGFSLDAQRERLAAYASATQCRSINEFIVDDGYSGGTLERPGILKLLSMVRSGSVGCIIITKLDRLSRSLRDVLNILDLCQRTETALLSASEALDTSSAVGKMLIHLLASFGEFERGRIAERTSDVLAFKRRSKSVYGPTPYGYRREGERLVPDSVQQNALALMVRLDAKGASLRRIATALTEARFAPPKGRAWHAQSVRRVLLSKMTTETIPCTDKAAR